MDPDVVKAAAEKRREFRMKRIETKLRDRMVEAALKKCDDAVAKYAQCTSAKLLSVAWACRGQGKAMNECLHQYTNDAVLEEYKQEYLKKQLQQKLKT